MVWMREGLSIERAGSQQSVDKMSLTIQELASAMEIARPYLGAKRAIDIFEVDDSLFLLGVRRRNIGR